MSSRRVFITTSVFFFLSVSLGLLASEWHVAPPPWGNNNNPGTNALPFATTQRGINASSDGDTVMVGQGTYVENIKFNGKNIVLTSTDPLDSAVVGFLRQIQRHLRGKMVLILDQWSVHKSAPVMEYLRRHSDTIRVEELPSYAPDLNPTEQVWNHTKYADLPNLAPNHLDELQPLVNSSITQTRGQSGLIRSFFRTAGLQL